MNPSSVACRLTILWMFKPVRVPWDAPSCCYLHTLTFANPEPSYVEARKRWHSFSNWLNETGKFGVCVPQWGEQTGRLHFHLVSSVRWDATEVSSELLKYGFGRYDVRERPVERALYAARYVGRKNLRPIEAEGMRLWSVFGKKHFPHGVSMARDCSDTVSTCYPVTESPQLFADWLSVRLGWSNESITIRLRHDAQQDGPTRMNEITTEQLKLAGVEMAKGGFAGLGEYRSCLVTTREMSDFKDKSKKVKRVFVEHRVEFGGAQKLIEERLPEGAVESAFVAPAKSGETVLFIAESVNTFNTRTTWKGKLVNCNGTVKK